MANIKALYGSDKLREMYPKVNENFTDINGEVNDLRQRVDNIITTPIDGEAAAQELVDARDNEASLGARLARDKQEVNAHLAENVQQTINKTVVNNAKKPAVSFVYDGSYTECLNVLSPIFVSKGVHATFGIQVGTINTAGNMTPPQILELQNTYGHQIVSHTITHPDLSITDEESLEYEFGESKRILEEMGCKNVNHLIYPGGNYDEQSMAIAKKYYTSASLVGHDGSGVYDNRMPINTYKLGRVKMADLSNPRTLEVLKGFVDTAIENKSWLIFYSHGSEYRNRPDEEQKLSDLIDYIQSKSVDILTVEEATKLFQNKIDIGFRGRNRRTSDDPDTYEYEGGYFFVGADGTLDASSNQLSYVIPNNSKPNNDTPLSSFQTGKITVNTLSIADNSGFPGIGSSAGAGILETHRPSASNSYAYQEFTCIAGQKYYRDWDPSNNRWLPWQPLTPMASSTSGRTKDNTVVGMMWFDTTLGKPIWVKTAGVRHVLTLTITSGAASSGNISIKLGSAAAVNVALNAGDNVNDVRDKIVATPFTGWKLHKDGGDIVFTKNLSGAFGASTFTDTDSTGVTANLVVTTSGVTAVWVDAEGNEV